MKRIFVTTRFAGMHQWAKAPAAQSFLRRPHRHLFHVRVDITVEHDDRELEFYVVLDSLHRFIDAEPKDDLGSCEMIAARLLAKLREEFGHDRDISVEVSEDGENGAVVDTFGITIGAT